VSIGLTDLPAIKASPNGAAAVLLAVGRWQINRRRVVSPMRYRPFPAA
jgi:hypothetical protein